MGMKIIPERISYGEEGKMYRRRKFREVWSSDKKLIFHREIKGIQSITSLLINVFIEYPEVYQVWKRQKFIDVVIFAVDECVTSPASNVIFTDVSYIEEMKQIVDEKTKPSLPSLSTDILQ